MTKQKTTFTAFKPHAVKLLASSDAHFEPSDGARIARRKGRKWCNVGEANQGRAGGTRERERDVEAFPCGVALTPQ